MNLLPSRADIGSLKITYLYLLGAALSPSHKIFFVVSLIYFLALLYWTRSIKKTIVYAFFPFWLFNVGRTFDSTVVPGEAINSPLYWEGRKIIFEFSPFFILGVTSIVVMFFHIIAGMKFRLGVPKYILFFLIAYLIHFVSAIWSPQLANFSFLFTLTEFFFLMWFLLALLILRASAVAERNKALVTLLLIFGGLLILESLITFLQVANRSVLGLSVEKVESIPSFGYGADENPFQFRPVGLSYHANALANWQVALLPSILLLWLRVKDTLEKSLANFIVTVTTGLSLLVISLTLSRSAYLGLFLSMVIFVTFNRRVLVKASGFLGKYLNNLKVVILIIILYLSLVVPDRLLNSLYSFTETGGFTTRQEQLAEAKELIYSHPLFGVGAGMFIPAAFELNPVGVMSYFPENIHNGFVLFLSERGVLAALMYLVGLYYLLKKIEKSQISKTVKLLMLSGIMANYVMMLFQPFINTLSLNVLITGLLLEVKGDEKL